jgi:hypothetical protein
MSKAQVFWITTPLWYIAASLAGSEGERLACTAFFVVSAIGSVVATLREKSHG